MMLRPVVAWPSANLSATSFRPGILGRELFLEALGALVERADAGQRGDQGDVALGLAVLGALMAAARPSAATRPPWTLSVVRNEVKALESAAESMPMILTDLAASSIGLPSALNCGRRDHDGGGLAGDGVLEDRDLAVDVGFGLGAELRHVDAEILAGLAGAGEHDLPVEGRGVLDDDGDRGRLGVGGRDEADGRCDQAGDEPGFLHGCFLGCFWRPAPCRSRFSHIRSRPAVSRPGSLSGREWNFFSILRAYGTFVPQASSTSLHHGHGANRSGRSRDSISNSPSTRAMCSRMA